MSSNSNFRMEKGNTLMKIIAIICVIFSLIIIISIQFITWGELNVDAEVKGGGLIGGGISVKASLESEFNQYSIDYEVITNRSGEVSRTKETKIFLTGMGDFQGDVGELVDSWSDKNYSHKQSSFDQQGYRVHTNVTIHTHSELIPWWPVDIAQKCSVDVVIDTYSANTEFVQIKRVWFELWYNWDDELDDYTKSKVVWEKNPNDKIAGVGAGKEYNAEISIDKDYGKAGIIGRMELSIMNKDGSEFKGPPPFASDSHPTLINIFTVEQGEFYNIILMVVAFPVTIIGMCFAIIAIPFIFKSHRAGTVLLLIALIIGILGFVFYINGLNTLVNVLDSSFKLNGLSIDVPAGFELNAMLIPAISMSIILLVIGFIISLLNQYPKIKGVIEPPITKKSRQKQQQKPKDKSKQQPRQKPSKKLEKSSDQPAQPEMITFKPLDMPVDGDQGESGDRPGTKGERKNKRKVKKRTS